MSQGEPDDETLEELVDEVATSSEGDLTMPGNQGWRATGQDVELTVKEIKAVQLRASGASYSDIAGALGYSNRSGAFKAVRRALQRWGSEAVEELRILELARLDQITLKLWPQVLGKPARDHGDGRIDEPVPPSMKAMELYLKVSQRRARLLGLDAPTMLDLVGSDDESQGDRVVADYEQLVELVQELADGAHADDDLDAGEGEAGGGAGEPAVEGAILPSQPER